MSPKYKGRNLRKGLTKIDTATDFEVLAIKPTAGMLTDAGGETERYRAELIPHLH